MKVVETIASSMIYRARTWDCERATRYVVDVDGRVVEGSHFAHFDGERPVKEVVELASSFGCSVGCHHCAAADLPQMRGLRAVEIIEQCELIAAIHGLTPASKFLITYSGIGEASPSGHRYWNPLPSCNSAFRVLSSYSPRSVSSPRSSPG